RRGADGGGVYAGESAADLWRPAQRARARRGGGPPGGRGGVSVADASAIAAAAAGTALAAPGARGCGEALADALSLQAGYSTTMVVCSAALLGIAAGGMGAFAMLRRQALVSEARAHATLPGVALAFLLAVSLGGGGGG